MSFVPEPTPRGYSYLEDAHQYYKDKRDNARFPPADFVTIGLRDIIVDEISKGKYGRWATLFVQDGVATFHKTSSGKFLINKVASVSLNRSVQGAAAISHVSKVIRTHGISNLGAMVYNDGKLLHRYYKGDINMTELYAGLLGEVGGQGGDMLG
ncbi:hypothetical protein FOMA001_g17321 [Fusarium oxysporum f. sp. matthiolae]|nr:hypothetical protein FOMA001_g17321 [Fusarium oxysporum f. sp. matthiolae]